MSPQFVDFDGDGRLDIVAGIFDGSPHVARGTEKGFAAPEQILDANGERIVLNDFWNFETKQWEETQKYDGPGNTVRGHMTSAVAFDWDGDGDLDLLLGDYKGGRVYRRINEGSAKEPKFTVENEVVLAGESPLEVPGKVATLRLVDWDGDGLLDLAASGMGDAYTAGTGAGIYVFRNEGTREAPRFGQRITLLAPNVTRSKELTRPDAGLYMDFADVDRDGDLDMVVGGYSMPGESKRQSYVWYYENASAREDGATAPGSSALRATGSGASGANDG